MAWSYDPSLEEVLKTNKQVKDFTMRDYLDTYGKDFGHGYYEKGWDLEKCLKDFFADPKIQELVLDNDWEEIFNYWTPKLKDHPANYAGWISKVLARFLWLANIDFWSYLSEDSVVPYEIGCMRWE